MVKTRELPVRKTVTRLFLIQKIMLLPTDPVKQAVKKTPEMMVPKAEMNRVDQRTEVPAIPTIITAGKTARDLVQVRDHQITDSLIMAVQNRMMKTAPEPALVQVIMKILLLQAVKVTAALPAERLREILQKILQATVDILETAAVRLKMMPAIITPSLINRQT